MKNFVLDYVNENEFKKLERALKKYNMLAFKKLNFDFYPALRNGKFLGEKIYHQAAAFGLDMEIEGMEISEFLKDGDKIKIGNGEIEVIEVPGHSKGSVALYDPKGCFLISGDALFKGSIGRTDLPGGNYKELIQSIEKFLLTLPDETVVLPGHGPASTIGEEKHSNPFLV